MNGLQGYSSDSDSDSDVETPQPTVPVVTKLVISKELPKTLSKPSLPTFTPPAAPKTPRSPISNNESRVLGKSIKNTFNSESLIKSNILFPESKIKSTDLLIPTQFLIKKKQNTVTKPKEVKETEIEKAKATDLGLDLFGIKGTIFHKKRELETKKNNSRFDALGGLSEISFQKEEEEQEQISLEPQPKKRRRNEIDESKIQDVRMDDFYRENNKMIEAGELDAKEHILKHSNIKYYQQGNNNLGDIIKFTESNKDKLTRKVGIIKAKEKDRGKQYGFK